MKMYGKSTLLIIMFLGTYMSSVIAQRPPGGGFDPDEMIKREKQNVFKALPDLNDDQKLLLDGIYEEFSLSFKELRDEMRQTRDFQAMRPKMEALQTEKNSLIKDVLDEDEYNIYLGIVEERRRERGNRPPGTGPGQTPPDNNAQSPELPQ